MAFPNLVNTTVFHTITDTSVAFTYSQGPLGSCIPTQPRLVIASLPTCKMPQHHSRTREELGDPFWGRKQTGQDRQHNWAAPQPHSTGN